MRKFLIVSVCLFASLMANANVSVTKSADGLADSITISGSLTDEEVEAARKQLSFSSVKIATGSYQLTQEDWEKIIPSGKLVIDKVANLDLSDARFEPSFLSKNNIGDKIGNRNKIALLTWSRYNDVPTQCFNSNSTLQSITIPDKRDGDENITIEDGAFSSMSGLTTLYIGSSVTKIGESLCQCSYAGQSKLQTVFLNTPEVTTLPACSFQWCQALKRIDLPYQLEEIGTSAFEFCSLETITFPNTLKTIRANAFHSCNLMYVVIPENVELIETNAFQENLSLTDVYVMGTKAKCQENGFSKLQNCQGFENKTTGYSEDNPASREDWTIGWGIYKTLVVLHYVAEDNVSVNNYENPYWTMLNTPGILDELKGFDANEENKKAFIEKYGLQYKNEFPWDLYYYANDNTKECPFAYYQFKDNSGKTKTCKIWRQERGYYAANEISQTGEDYAGWKQFLIVQDDAKQNTFDDEHRVDDRWYSMCFPFDLNANQIRTAYGAGTEVCEFIGAWDTKEQTSKGENIISFRFKPLLDEIDEQAISENNQESRGFSPIITHANRAYMIHPASKKEGDNTNVWHRIIPGIPVDAQKGIQANLIPTIPERNKQEIMDRFDDGESELLSGYEFVGNYEEDVKLPANTYYFAYRNHADGTRTLILNHLTRESKNIWTPMTALVKYTGAQASSAKCYNAFDFSPIKNGETTGIDDITPSNLFDAKGNCNQKVYNLNGQIVKEGANINDLKKGVYILNGKKYIVK